MISDRQPLLTLLDAAHLEYQLHEHPAVFTAEEGEQYCAHIPGAHVKNLFLRNEKKTAYWLVTIKYHKRVDLSQLAKILNGGRLSFANHHDLKTMLGVTPGSVTPIAIINDHARQVKLIFDQDLLQEEYINIHPMENTSTITMKLADLHNFIEQGHQIKIDFAMIPEKSLNLVSNDFKSKYSYVEVQVNQCLELLNEIFKNDLLGVYLYGSSILGGLHKYSDIDIFVVSNRATAREEKAKLATALLKISGIYMKSKKLPVEMTIVEHSEINPWHYPPKFDFQYGDWLREQFESGNSEPWSTKEMPDLALLVTQVLLASITLMGANPDQLLCKVPYKDFMIAITDALPNLMSDLDSDTRNVLLTFARIWCTVETDTIRSKQAAADWAIVCLPEKYHQVIKRAKAIYKGETEEHWDDIQELIKPCADFIINQINNEISKIKLSDCANKSIKLAE